MSCALLLALLAASPDAGTLRIRAVGDVMMGSDFPEPFLPDQDGATYFSDVAELLKDADLTFFNMEGPLCDGGQTRKCAPRSKRCYAFRTPTRFAKYLTAVGVDLASTANNHSGDFGDECRRQTEKALEGEGIVWSGAPGTVGTVERKGFKVALVAFHTSPNVNNVNDLPTARRLVREAAATHDLVWVSFHGGAEGAKAQRVPKGREKFAGEDRGDLRQFSHALVDEGADLVTGHGPHVVRGMEVYRDRLIAYSLGNFATYGKFNLSGPLGLGVILEATLAPDGSFLEGRIFPTKQVGQGIPQQDPEGRVLNLLQRLSAEDFLGTAVKVAPDGALSR